MKTLIRVFVPISLLVVAFFVWFLQSRRVPDKNVISDGYVGFITLVYDDPNAPPLKEENGYNIVIYNTKGECHTSSKLQEGYAKDVYVYVTKSGTETVLNASMIRNENSSRTGKLQEDGTMKEHNEFEAFIGSEAQLEKALKKKYGN